MKKNVRLLRRFLFLFLAVLVALPGFAGQTQAFAQEYVPDTTPVLTSGDYAYKVYDDGSVEIVEYNGRETDLVIPEELDGKRVTAVGDQAFSYCDLDSLTIPEGISVGGRAFEYCSIEKTLSLPEGIVIRGSAFDYAELPKSVVIPEGAVLSGDCFAYCEDVLRLFVAPSAVVKGSAFGYSEDLRTLICAPGSEIADDAFEYSYQLTGVMLCGDVTLGKDPFPYCRKAKLINESAEQYDVELERYFGPRQKPAVTGGTSKPADTTGTKVIGQAAALKIALDDAGLKESDVRDLDVELEKTLRKEYYEVDFEYGPYDYEYKIEAYTGEIITFRRER